MYESCVEPLPVPYSIVGVKADVAATRTDVILLLAVMVPAPNSLLPEIKAYFQSDE